VRRQACKSHGSGNVANKGCGNIGNSQHCHPFVRDAHFTSEISGPSSPLLFRMRSITFLLTSLSLIFAQNGTVGIGADY